MKAKYLVKYTADKLTEGCIILELADEELNLSFIKDKINTHGYFGYLTIIDIHKL